MKEKFWNYTYKITNLINDKYYYGCHSSEEYEDNYMGSGKILKRAIIKHGKENFEMKFLKNFSTRKEMFKEEAKLVDEKEVDNLMCYNLKGGGYGNSGQLSKESIEKIASKLRGRAKETDASLASMSEKMKGMTAKTHKHIRDRAKKIRGRNAQNDASIANMVKKLSGRTKEDYEYLRLAGLKRKGRKGRTKETHAGTASQAEKLKGRTKETHSYLLNQANKMIGRTKETHPYLASNRKGKNKYNDKSILSTSKKMTGRTAKNHFGVFVSALKKSKGLYVTPNKTFYSSTYCAKELNTNKTIIIRYCVSGNKKNISNRRNRPEFLNDIETKAKTYKEAGFSFIPFPDNCLGFEDRKQFAIENGVNFD